MGTGLLEFPVEPAATTVTAVAPVAVTEMVMAEAVADPNAEAAVTALEADFLDGCLLGFRLRRDRC